LNGYSWVEGNVMNGVDPSGLICNYTKVIYPSFIKVGNYRFKGNVLDSQALLNSSIIIYTFRDGTPDESGRSCQLGQYPASMSLGVLTTDGIYSHDHYSFSDVQDLNAPTLIPISNFARTPEEAKRNLKRMSCIEFRGKNGNIAMSGNALTFNDNLVLDGIIVFTNDFSSIGSLVPISEEAPNRGQTVTFIKNTNILAISRKPVRLNDIIPSSYQGSQHSDLITGTATIDWSLEYKDFGYGLKPVFATGEKDPSVYTRPGDSGGGWFNENGELIGITIGAGQVRWGLYWFYAEYFTPILQG
jgi:hypothetical protein